MVSKISAGWPRLKIQAQPTLTTAAAQIRGLPDCISMERTTIIVERDLAVSVLLFGQRSKQPMAAAEILFPNIAYVARRVKSTQILDLSR